MSAVTFRVDEKLKAVAIEQLSVQGISLSDALRDTLTYTAETGRATVKRTLVADEDAQLIEIVRERLKNPTHGLIRSDSFSGLISYSRLLLCRLFDGVAVGLWVRG